MKISHFQCDITPEPGTLLAGYGPHVVSRGIHDPLMVCGALLEDSRKNRLLLLSFDLLGLDSDVVRRIRESAGKILHLPPEAVIASCTHTHAGPHTRSIAGCTLNVSYLKKMERILRKALAALPSPSEECEVYHYSCLCDENINRRVILPDNRCTSLPYRKELLPLASGIRDRELSFLLFASPDDKRPLYLICNYAAHPLSGQSDGLSGQLISADYPGVLRRVLAEQLGIESMFLSGACGDLHPADFESGFERTEKMGRNIAGILIRNISDALRQPERFRYPDPLLDFKEIQCSFTLRKSPPCTEDELPLYRGKRTVSLPVALGTVGDTALVGVPGELLTEPGLEIKWHSPFRQTMILYNSTGYLSYICHANALLSGGYEAETSHVDGLGTLKMVYDTTAALHRMKSGLKPKRKSL